MSWWSSKPSETELIKKEVEQIKEEMLSWKSKYTELEKKIEDSSNKNTQQIPSLNTHVYYDGSVYQGEVDETGKYHGKGIYIYWDGTRYVGEWDHGLYHGEGVLYMPGWKALYANWDHHKLHGECWYDGGEDKKMIYDQGKMVVE